MKILIVPPLTQKNFGTGVFFETEKCSPTKSLGTVRHKCLRQKFVISASFPSKKNSTLELIWNTEGSPYKFFGTLTQINFGGRSWYTPSSYRKHFLLPEIFWNTEGFAVRIFRYSGANIFRWKFLTHHPLPLFSTENFNTGSFLKIRRISDENVQYIETKISDGKMQYPFIHKNFLYQIFSRNTKGFLYKFCSLLWDEIIDWKLR